MKEFLARSLADHGGKPNTHHRAETSSKALLRYFGDKRLDQITVDEVERFKDWRVTPNLYTTLDELDKVYEVAEHGAKRGLPKSG